MRLTRVQSRRFQLEQARLPLVALIDVVLFLLIYFVMAGNLAAEESALASALRTDRPGPSGAADLVPVILTVEAGDAGSARFRLGQRLVTTQEDLKAALDKLPKQQGVVVRVRPDVTVSAAAIALQAATDAGFDKVSYVPAR